MNSAARKMDKRKIQHSYVCAYLKCGIRSRDNIPGIKFHKLPLNNKDIVAGWLINAGLDERANDPEHELRKIVICSRHFSKNSICPTGRLKKGAMPFEYDNDGKDDDQNSSNDRIRKDRTVEREIMLKRLEKNTTVIRRQEMRIKELAATIDKKSWVIKKLRTRLYLIIISGIVDDDDLAKALGRRFINRIQTSEKLKLLEAIKDESMDECSPAELDRV